MKNIKYFLMKFSIFDTEKILYILHGQVFVMIAIDKEGTVFFSTTVLLYYENIFKFCVVGEILINLLNTPSIDFYNKVTHLLFSVRTSKLL